MPVQGAAFIAKSAEIDGEVQVADRAKVVHHAVIRGQVRVLGDAFVGHHARVLGGPGPQGVIYLHGTAQVDGHATIGSGADIACRRHLLTITGVGPLGHTLTVYRRHPVKHMSGTWRWTHGAHLAGWYGDLAGLGNRADDDADLIDWDGTLLDELDATLALAQTRAYQWTEEDVTNADRRRWQLRDSDLRRAPIRATRGGRIEARR